MRHFPKYPARPHSTGLARIVIDGRSTYLGAFGSPESHQKYLRLLTEWQVANGTAGAAAPAGEGLTVAQGVARWWAGRGDAKYRDRETGAATVEHGNYRRALQVLLDLYGGVPLSEFRAKQLKAVRQRMADLGWCRRVTNRALSRVKLVFRWLESEELVARGTWEHLQTVGGLEEGEGGARETGAVLPASEESIALSLPHFNKVTRAVIELLLLSGARPGELLKMKPEDVNTAGTVELGRGYKVRLGDVWAYQPARHKTAHKGHRRVILFGPRAQAILKQFLEGRPPGMHLFRPVEGREDWLATKRKSRQTPVQPSQQDRRKKDPKKLPGEKYDVTALNHAIRYACARAEKLLRQQLLERGGPVPPETEVLVPPFSANQLRHNAASRLCEEFSLDVATAILGHRHLQTTLIYALEALRKAAEAQRQTG